MNSISTIVTLDSEWKTPPRRRMVSDNGSTNSGSTKTTANAWTQKPSNPGNQQPKVPQTTDKIGTQTQPSALKSLQAQLEVIQANSEKTYVRANFKLLR